MNNKIRIFRSFCAAMLIAAFLFSSLPVFAQGDVVPVEGITGGSSVFVFRKSSKAPPLKFVSRQRTIRTKEQRLETAKKLNTQYVNLARVAPRRARIKAVDPNNLPDAIRIKSMPKDDAAKLFAGVGEYYIDRNDSENAIKFFRETLDLNAKNTIAPNGLSEALSLKGNELLVKDQPSAAKAYFDEALKYNANNAVALYGLAEVFSNEQKDPEAIANYEKALRNDKELTEIYVPLGILYYQAGEIAKADEVLTKAAMKSPDSAETQYFLGMVRFTQNRNVEALAAFQKATVLQPTYAEAYYQAGETLERLNKTREAISEYQNATANKANYFEAWLALGSAFYETGDYKQAISAYEKAVRLKNDNIQAHINLGDAYRQDSNFEKAESEYNLAASFIERTKDFDKIDAADTYNKIGFVIARQCPINLKKFMPCRWNTATRSLEKAVALTQDNIDYANLGWAYYNAAQNDFIDKKDAEGRIKLEKARINLQKVANVDSKYLNAPLLNLGMALTNLGEYKSAIDALNKVVQREPKWTFALNELGIAYLLNKDYKNAINQFKKVIDRDDKFAPAYFNLGKAEFASGNNGEAKKNYQKLRKIGRNDLADRLDRETGGAVSK